MSKRASKILTNQRNKSLLGKAALTKSLLNCGPSAFLAKDKSKNLVLVDCHPYM